MILSCRYRQTLFTHADNSICHEKHTCQSRRCKITWEDGPKVPFPTDSQSLQLGSYMSGEPTPTTSITPSLAWLAANSHSGMGTSKAYDPHFRVPGSMQIAGPTLSGKTTWLSKLIQDAVTYCVCFGQALYCYLYCYLYFTASI